MRVSLVKSGRVVSSVGDPTDYAAVTAALLAATDGTTVAPTGRPYSGDGILVALPDYAATFVLAGPATLPLAVDQWVRSVDHVVTATSSPRRYFGAWSHDGLLYLDVSEAWSAADEADAIAAATARGELAIWHNGRQEEIVIRYATTIDPGY